MSRKVRARSSSSTASASVGLLKHLFADGAYDRTKLLDKAAYLDFVVEIVRRNEEQAGFHVIRRRWVVDTDLAG